MAFDWNFVAKFYPLFLRAAWLTLWLGLLGTFLASLVGFIGAIITYARVPGLNRLFRAYVEVSRNTPLLIQLFFLYFGLPKMGIMLESRTAAMLGLAFLGGGYMAEAIRAGLGAVPPGQLEAGYAIGLTRAQVIRHVLLPQAFAVAMPAIGANVIFLLKETSVFSVVALADLMFVAKDLIGMYYRTNEALLMLVLAYLLLLLPLSLLFYLWERKLRHAGFGG
ncbi:MAG: amino acid ABC transporter permease [Planctomycetota bacterium]|jgi:polar amino acid transport system permease protein|nr:amino acid ABC transporter permease [Planctomycetota bacterium]